MKYECVEKVAFSAPGRCRLMLICSSRGCKKIDSPLASLSVKQGNLYFQRQCKTFSLIYSGGACHSWYTFRPVREKKWDIYIAVSGKRVEQNCGLLFMVWLICISRTILKDPRAHAGHDSNIVETFLWLQNRRIRMHMSPYEHTLTFRNCSPSVLTHFWLRSIHEFSLWPGGRAYQIGLDQSPGEHTPVQVMLGSVLRLLR